MSRVVVAGTGFHPFGKFPEKSLKQLSSVAIMEALREARIELRQIEAAFVGNAFAGLTTGQESVRGQVILRSVGLDGIPVINVENACASGSTALHQAWVSILAGLYETVLVLGAEKLFVGNTARSIRAISSATDVETMGSRGLQFTALYAMSAKQYMKKYGTTIEDIALVAVKNSRNGSLNPIAQFRKPLSVEQVLSSRMISEPLTLYMCSSIADGAAAVVLMSERKARQVGITTPVYIRGCQVMSGIYQRRDGDYPRNAVTVAAEKTYSQAGIGPKELDVVEVHDAAASSEISHLESLGLVPPGTGYEHLKRGRFNLDGDLPVNPSGGLLSRGHPVGATGVAQVCEIVRQLRQEAGERNIRNGKKPRSGLCLNTGGRVDDDRAAIVTTILSL
ncbi:MAG TPA: thiolase family protein [Paenibacillaceae bacterium]